MDLICVSSTTNKVRRGKTRRAQSPGPWINASLVISGRVCQDVDTLCVTLTSVVKQGALMSSYNQRLGLGTLRALPWSMKPSALDLLPVLAILAVVLPVSACAGSMVHKKPASPVLNQALDEASQ